MSPYMVTVTLYGYTIVDVLPYMVTYPYIVTYDNDFEVLPYMVTVPIYGDISIYSNIRQRL